jgi:hypothetical protein
LYVHIILFLCFLNTCNIETDPSLCLFASKAKGKSGGARVITHTVLVESHGADITLVTIYDKSDQASITDRELKILMKKNGLE